MADKTNINDIKTIRGFIAELRKYRNESVTNDPDFARFCDEIFTKAGIRFDPADVEADINAIRNEINSKRLDANKKISDFFGEVVEIETKSDIGSRSLNQQDLKVLLDEYDKHSALEAKEIEREASKNPLLRGVRSADILKTIETKIRIQAELIAKNLEPTRADRISDRIIETEQTVRGIVNGETVVDTYLLAEEIVIAAESATDAQQAIQKAKEIIPSEIKGDANEVLQILVETERSRKEVDTKVNEISTKLVEKLEDGNIRLTAAQKNEVLELVNSRLEELTLDSQIQVETAKYELKPNLLSKQVAVLKEKGLTESIKGVVLRSLPTDKEELISKSVKDAAGEVNELCAVNNASNGKEIGELMSALTQKGAGAAQIKELLKLRMGGNGEGIENFKATLHEERQVEISLKEKGFNDPNAASEANVIKSMLKSDQPIKKTLEIIEKSRGIMRGVKKMDSVMEVAGTLSKNKQLSASTEMVRKLLKSQEFFDKWTGGVFSKATGSAISSIGKMTGFPGLEKFGVSILNKMGLEAMSTHIAAFGLEGGLKNILIQLFKTGTVKAVEATAVAGAEAAAAGTMGAIAGISTGPIGWALLAATLLLEAGKYLAGKAYDTVKNVLGDILSFLGIGSAKTIDGVKDFLGNAVKWGGMALGAIATAILSIPTLLTGGAFALVSTVMVIVLAALIGYNIFQTASTQISASVAPQIPEAGGVCVNTGKPKSGVTGKINCDQTVPEQRGTTVNKANFVRVAEAWRSGGGKNAELCFNDVVKRASGAGINADYALWAWLHESGASNYTGFPSVSDFGVIYVKPNDFSAQITAFLKLDMGSACPALGDYWLSFATNYLTGKCDPDVEVSGTTGRLYKNELLATWKWITSAPMPSTIHTSSGGSGSGGSANPQLETITEDDGSVLVCEVPTNSTGAATANSPLPTLDPSIRIPEGCPAMRPVSGGYISQGPMAAGCSHANMPNAVDFAVGDGTPIMATHDGIARVGSNSIYGNFVDVTGSCNGATFTTRYAHMPNGGAKVGSNVVVKKGQQIGVVDNTGSSTGSHLHYDFRNVSGGSLPKISATIGSAVDLTGCCGAENGIYCK